MKYKWSLDAWNKIRCVVIEDRINPKKLNKLMKDLTMITDTYDSTLFKEELIKKLKKDRRKHYIEANRCLKTIEEINNEN